MKTDNYYNPDRRIEKEEPVLTSVKSEDEEKTIEVEATPVLNGEITNCIRVNVRSYPKIADNVIVILENKSQVKIDSKYKSEEWCKVYTETGAKGYVKKEFVKEV